MTISSFLEVQIATFLSRWSYVFDDDETKELG